MLMYGQKTRRAPGINAFKCCGFLFSLLLRCLAVAFTLTNGWANAIPEDAESLEPPEGSLTLPSVFSQKPFAEIGGSYEHLTNGYTPWASQYLDVTVPLHSQGLVNVNILNANRFSQNDTAGYLNYAYPFRYGVLSAEGGYTVNPQFLTKDLYGIGWNGRLPYSFNYLLSARTSQYLTGDTQTINMGVDKYYGEYRFAYTLVRSVLDYSERSWLSKFQVQWLGESGHKLGLLYATGHEPMVVTIGNLSNIDVVTYQADGLYKINQTFGLTVSLWHAVQGSYYQRNGGQLGVRVAF
ncbi:MAG: YaiO family outer membrane beta-barrel protein [Rhodocyclaceae bacterium]|nr:YaiO family outer membrane beta-barrel protein [Rhodocyclaceae bacterium]